MAEDEKNPRLRGYIVAYSLTKPHIYITFIISRFFFYGIPTRARAPDSGPFPGGPQGPREPHLQSLHLMVPKGSRNPRVQLYIISNEDKTRFHHQQDVTSYFTACAPKKFRYEVELQVALKEHR